MKQFWTVHYYDGEYPCLCNAIAKKLTMSPTEGSRFDADGVVVFLNGEIEKVECCPDLLAAVEAAQHSLPTQPVMNPAHVSDALTDCAKAYWNYLGLPYSMLTCHRNVILAQLEVTGKSLVDFS